MPPRTFNLTDYLKPGKRRRHVSATLEDLLFADPVHQAPCQQSLWRAVITQALTDALSNNRKRSEQKSKREALEWLKSNSRDFRTVCDFAGYEPDYIHALIEEFLLRHRRNLAAEKARQTPKLFGAQQHDFCLHYMRSNATKQTEDFS